MWLDLGPLKRNPNFLLLYTGQFVSTLGTMTAYVALPYQVYQLTHSPLLVGLLGGVQLIPVLLFGLLGGALADALDRKRLLALSEAVMALGALGLVFNALSPTPSVGMIFALAFVTQAASALHRPTLEALKQSLVSPDEYPAMGSLSAFQGSFCAIMGPALGGVMMSQWGTASVFGFDLLTYLVGLGCILALRLPLSAAPTEAVSLQSIREGLNFAWARPALIGTYIVDIVAMLFAFPTALYPAMAKAWGGAPAAGLLYSAMAVGSLGISLFSGRLNRIRRRGAGVIVGASLWGLAIIALGFAPGLWWAFALLVLAGGADMISGLYRGVIWNESIPNSMRGRLAGIEMISYLSGPLLGNLRAGWMAEQMGLSLAIWSGGVICTLAVLSCIWLLPAFWHYRPEPVETASNSA
ncbi:MAG: MFS transporter [Candidatus Sericytochromatia bacterium]|nr:MFS transporter [Candidatus Sericytochromatia bacterium]